MAGDRPTVYTTTWCPYSRSLVNDLRYFGVAFDEVDVDADDEAADLVRSLNGGDRVVPTVVYPDGSHDTNPDGAEVAGKMGLFGSDPE
ncbi:NrdH-redoxin [Propioniciclava sp. MC1595]|uniref:glutaredoxin domain-containing protein n=1 Tax=Propioniciclava sp. MC1595 TaxID=2760308 RepID=UPI0016622F88|nr:glutaredoxin domain-containing protein [Propioniciclava sp. MC1595]MBB1495162.1 NrdH-redoxin [Propioniciclava sp. MC1595]QTE26295.1 NrdH-redoxin [Propioniciclava sp. MC1595]